MTDSTAGRASEGASSSSRRGEAGQRRRRPLGQDLDLAGQVAYPACQPHLAAPGDRRTGGSRRPARGRRAGRGARRCRPGRMSRHGRSGLTHARGADAAGPPDPAGAFVGDHAGPDRRARGAGAAEQRALVGVDPAQHDLRAAAAGRHLTRCGAHAVRGRETAARRRGRAGRRFSAKPEPGITPMPRQGASTTSSVAAISRRAAGLPPGRTSSG